MTPLVDWDDDDDDEMGGEESGIMNRRTVEPR